MTSRTLWIWATLPKKLKENSDQSWLTPGDAVENAQRLSLSKYYKLLKIPKILTKSAKKNVLLHVED